MRYDAVVERAKVRTAAVQKTIRREEPNAPVASIRKHVKDGQVVYDVSFKEKGLNPKMTVAEDGTLLKDLQK